MLSYTGNINKVKFSLSGTDRVIENSFVEITSADMYRNNMPFETGIYDKHLGTNEYSYDCNTCLNKKKKCLGHEGNLKLEYPVWNPFAVAEIRKYVKLICFECGNPIIDDKTLESLPKGKRLEEASKIARAANKRCVHCTAVHYIVKKDKKEQLLLTAELLDNKRIVDKYIIYPHMLKNILGKITDETVLKLGRNPISHPRNFILDHIRIPAITIRPDIKGSKSKEKSRDLNSILQMLVKKSKSINIVDLSKPLDPKTESALIEFNNMYYDFIKSPNDSVASIAQRLKGKKGRARKTQLGKRVFLICRSTVANDRKLKIDEVGVPILFATTIQIPEVVQEYNMARLLGYVHNGKKIYPGASQIKRKASRKIIDITDHFDHELEIGDVVYRDMINGDVVCFNRQPSLCVSNIAAHKVVVNQNPDIRSLTMNVIICPFKL